MPNAKQLFTVYEKKWSACNNLLAAILKQHRCI
jgi:hypothetical protein